MGNSGLQIWSLQGILPYLRVRDLQLQLVELRSRELIPDTVLFLEHSPVVTRGKGLQFTGSPRSRSIPLQSPLPADVEFAESERGGDLTYHGPGQLVVYPICKLDGQGWAPNRDIAGFLRNIENLLMGQLEQLGMAAHSKKDATGVWIGEHKVASLGIAVKKWVSYHGMAINCVNDLKPFFLISPCGFQPEIMTCLQDWIPLSTNWRGFMETSLANQFERGAQVRSLSLQEAEAISEDIRVRSEGARAPSELLHRP